MTGSEDLPIRDRKESAMGTRKVLLGGVVLGSVGFGGLIGAIFAPGLGFATSDTQAGTRGFDVCIGAGGSLDAAAEEIGIDTAELASALRDGDTFADVARTHDVPVPDVVDAIVVSERERLDELVDDGRLTREQADALSADLRERASDLVNGDLAPFPIIGGPGIGLPGMRLDVEGPLADAADAIGVDESELMSALRDGDTIADIARAHDLPVSEVVDAIVASMQARLDAAVAQGWLTHRQADGLAAELGERASDLVNGMPAIFPDVPGAWPLGFGSSELSVS
jgi:hypothetical protein